MTNGTIELIHTILVAVAGFTAAAAICGLALGIIRHFMQSGKNSQDYSRLADKTKRSVGTLFGIAFLAGIGGAASGSSSFTEIFTSNPTATTISNKAGSDFVPEGIELGKGITWIDPTTNEETAGAAADKLYQEADDIRGEAYDNVNKAEEAVEQSKQEWTDDPSNQLNPVLNDKYATTLPLSDVNALDLNTQGAMNALKNNHDALEDAQETAGYVDDLGWSTQTGQQAGSFQLGSWF